MAPTIQDLEKRVKALEQQLEEEKDSKAELLQNYITLQEQNTLLKEQNRLLQEKLDRAESIEAFIGKMAAYETEKAEREKRRNNIVIYGMAEEGNTEEEQKQSDREVVEDMILSSGNETAVIANVFRMGKPNVPERKYPRLLKVQLKNYDAKRDLMKKQREILPHIPRMNGADYSQYLRDDLTEFQRKIHSALVVKRNSWNARDGYTKTSPNRWKIYNWEVVQHIKKETVNGDMDITQ